MKRFLKGVDITKLFLFIGGLDLSILIINCIYHFIIHGFYKTFWGILFLVLFFLTFISVLILGKLNIDSLEEISMFLLAFLGILWCCFIVGVTIATIRITFPIFLIIQWSLAPLCFIVVCANENI